jgi:uncharacterized membrane protein YfcA
MVDLAVMAIAMLGTGVVGGILAGLLGVGGGIVIVPVLEIVLGILGVPVEVRMHVAVATSLAVIIPTSISSARAHHERQSVDLELVRRWAVFMLVGAVTGIVIASMVDGVVLSAVFGIVALAVAVKMALPLDERVLTPEVPKGLATGAIPLVIGAISTMMGIGGGTLSVPALTLMNTPIHRAVGTSALFGLLISIPGAIGFAIAGWGNELLPAGSLGFVNVIGFVLIAPVTVIAAPLGAKLAHALSRRNLSLLFGLFLLAVAARMLYRTFQG